MAKPRKRKPAKRKSAKRRSSAHKPAPKPAPKGGGHWPMIFVAVLALLVGMAAGWHVRDSGMAAHAAPGAQTRSAEPAAVRAGRQAVDHWLKTVASGNAAAVPAMRAPDRQSVRSRLLPEFAGARQADRLVPTAYGEHMVARYELRIDGKQGDRPVPPLTVSAGAAPPGF